MPKITTVIGTQTEILGDVHFSGGLHLDGRVQGSVTAVGDETSLLMISASGEVAGDIRVGNLVLNGTVVGDVYASQLLELAPEAKVSGTVFYSVLEMARGAEVNGKLVCNDEQEPPRLGYEGDPGGMGKTADEGRSATADGPPPTEGILDQTSGKRHNFSEFPDVGKDQPGESG